MPRYVVVRSAIDIYARHWCKQKEGDVKLQERLISEKAPRTRLERDLTLMMNMNCSNPDLIVSIESTVSPNEGPATQSAPGT